MGTNYFLIILLFVITIGINTFFLHADAVSLIDESTILQTGIISTNTNNYQISNNFDLKFFMNEQMMRMFGTTIDGFPYYVVHKIVNDEVQVKGKIIVDGNIIPIQYQSEIVLDQETITEEKPELLIVVIQPHSTNWQYHYTISVKVFDNELNPEADYWDNYGTLSGIPITVNITHKNSGNPLTFLEGKTDQGGVFQAQHYVVENLTWEGEYLVEVTADNRQIQNLTTSIYGVITSDGTGPPPP